MSRIAESLSQGYSYEQIADFLSDKDTRVSASRAAGHSDEDIVNFLRANESAIDMKAKAQKDAPVVGGLLSQSEKKKKPSLIEGITGAELQDSPRVVPTYTDTLKSTEAAAKAVPTAPITPTNTFADASRQTITAQEIAKQSVKQDNAGKMRAMVSTAPEQVENSDKPFLRGLGSATGDMIAGSVGAFGQAMDATGFGTPESVSRVYKNLKDRADSIRPEDVSKMSEMDQAAYYLGSGLATSAGSLLAIVQPELALPYLGVMGVTTSGNKYQSLRERGVEKPEAQANALVTGTAEALTEMLGIKGGQRVMQFYSKLPLDARRQLTKRLLLGTGVIAMGAAEEGTEELINKQVENATDILTGAFMQQTERGNQKTAGKLANTRIAEGSGEAFKGGAYGGLLFGAGGAVVADQQTIKPNSPTEVMLDQMDQAVAGSTFVNDGTDIALGRMSPENAQYTTSPTVTNQQMGDELLGMEVTAPRATVDDIMAQQDVDAAIAAAQNMVDTPVASLDVAEVVASVTQPEEMLDGRTDVGGQDAEVVAQGVESAGSDIPGSGTDTQAGMLGGLAGGSGSAGSMATPDGVDSVAGDAGVQGLTADTAMWLGAEDVAGYLQDKTASEKDALLAEIRRRDASHADEIQSLLPSQTPDTAPAPKTDGSSEVVGANGMRIVHGSGNANLTADDIQIVRQGQKQGKKGRSYGGLYGASETDLAQAEEYAAMMGGSPTVYDITIQPGTRVLHKEGDITRLSETYINDLVAQGYGLVTGRDMRGRNEYVVIDRNAVAAMQPRSTPINQAGEPVAPQLTQLPQTQGQTQSPQVTSEGAAPAVVVTPAQQKVVDAVNASLVDEQAKLGDKAPPLQQLTVAAPEQVTPAVQEALPLAQAFLQAAGYQHEMVVVAPTDDKTLDFDGAVASNGAGIVIAADSARTVPRVVVHEFGHEMRKEAPQVWETLAAEILGRTDKAAQLAHLKKRGYAGETMTPPMAEEFVNDVLSDMLNSGKEGPRILVDVASNMDKAEPGSGKEFLKRLLEFIDKVIKGMVGKGYGTEATILKGEVGAIRKAIAKALTDYNLQAKKAEKAKAAAEATKAKDEAEAAKKAALAAEVERAKGKKPLYVKRNVENAKDIIAWASGQGFASTLEPSDMHVTLVYSREPFDRGAVLADVDPMTVVGGERVVKKLGDGGAVVLAFESDDLQNRWKEYRDAGASWDYDGYTPHITLTYAGEGVDLASVTQYQGDIVLGGEIQEALNEDKADEYVEKPTEPTPPADTKTDEVAKADEAGVDAAPVEAKAAPQDPAPRNMKEAREWLYRRVDEAMQSAPKRADKVERIQITKLGTVELMEQALDVAEIKARAIKTLRDQRAAMNEVASAQKGNPKKIGDILGFVTFRIPNTSISYKVLNSKEDLAKFKDKLQKATGAFKATEKITPNSMPPDGPKRSLRNVITQDTRDALVKGWTQIGGADTAFTYPRSESKSLREIMLKVAPRLQVEHIGGDVDLADGWMVFAKDADGKADRTRPGYVMQYKDGKVELNVAEWGEGNDGAALYAAVGNYAYNNGLVFAGDRMGISDTGRARRLENMISLALKYKTTRHIEPHVDMLVDFSWEEGNDNYNLGEMLAASYRLTAEIAPEIEDIVYDPDTKEFTWVPAADRRTGRSAGDGQDAAAGYNADTYAAGETVSESDFKKIVEDARDRGGRIGRKTLVRAILSNTFARRAQADEGAGERAGDVVVPRDVTDGVLYSKRGKDTVNQVIPTLREDGAAEAFSVEEGDGYTIRAQTMRDAITVDGQERPTTNSNGKPIAQTEEGLRNFWKWFGESKVVDEHGRPLVVYHGTGKQYGNRGEVISGDFDTFDKGLSGKASKTGAPEGTFFFSNDPEVASSYTVSWRGDFSETYRDNANVMPVYIKIDKPAKVNAKGENWREVLYKGEYSDVNEIAAIVQEAGKNDGVVISKVKDHGVGKTSGKPSNTYIAFDPTQIKSAIGNDGTFDGSNPDIRRSRRAPLQHYGVPKTWGNGGMVMTPMDSAIYTLQDKHIELKRAVQEIKATGAHLDDKWDPYLTEELFHGRGASRAQAFIKDELEPLTKDLLGAGIAIAEMDDYLWARHAINRNEEIEKINPEQVDANGDRNGSGLTDAEAQAKLDALTPAAKAQLESFAVRVDAINAETRRLMVEYGLETQRLIDEWEQKYPTYVPLMRDVEDEGGMGSGAGFSTGGKTGKRAMGSARPVENVLANIANQRDKVINKGEKNRVALAVYGAALLNPNPDFWGAINPLKINDNTPANIAAIEKARLRQELTAIGLPDNTISNMVDRPTEKSIHPITGMVVRSVNPLYSMSDNILSLRVNGEDRFVVFNPTNEKAVRAIAALKNLEVADRTYADPIVENTMHAVGAMTRYFSKINTQYNPVFGAVNFVRDVQGALLNLESTELKGQQKEILGDISRLMKDAAKHGFRMEKLDPADLVLWKEMLKEGGTTGYRDLFKTGRERHDAIVKALDPKHWQTTKWGKILTANGYLSGAEQLLIEKTNGVVQWLSDYNETMENVTRLAVFKAARDHGLSGAKAASLSKNITTNFNRRGSIGQQAGMLYAFFNAAVQGTTRIADTLLDRSTSGKYTVSKAGKAIIGGGLLVGMLQPLLLALAGYGDDEPPEFVRDRNLIIPLWTKDSGVGYATIPMPLGFHVIPALSRIPVEAAMHGNGPGDVMWKLMSVFLEAFNPLGGSGMSLQTIAPTIVDPMVSLATNKDWNGRPIYQESFSNLNQSPGHSRAKDTSTELGYAISYAINRLSGGDEYQAGEWSPTPDAVEYMIGQITGGVGREVMKAWKTGKNLATGEAVAAHQIPLAGRFYGRSDGKSGEGAKFYDNLKYFNELRREKLDRIEAKDNVSQFKMDNPDHVLIDVVMAARTDINKLRKHKDELKVKGASRERIRLIDDKITGRMARINEKIEKRRERLAD